MTTERADSANLLDSLIPLLPEMCLDLERDPHTLCEVQPIRGRRKRHAYREGHLDHEVDLPRVCPVLVHDHPAADSMTWRQHVPQQFVHHDLPLGARDSRRVGMTVVVRVQQFGMDLLQPLANAIRWVHRVPP
jgi:hypothetical protein